MGSKLPYSPWDQLPDKSPMGAEYPVDHFYNATAKHLVKDTVRIMDNGLAICMDRVSELEDTIRTAIGSVHKRIEDNELVQEFLETVYKEWVEAYRQNKQEKLRTKEDYLKPFKHNDMNHRSYFMHFYAEFKGYSAPEELLPTGVPKWPAALVKKYAKNNNVLLKLLKGELPPNNRFALKAMELLAEHKAAMYNEKYLADIEDPKVKKPRFNPGSPQQKQKFFSWVGIPSDAQSKKTGNDSWDRDQIENVNTMTVDPKIREFTQALIDYSFSSIIASTFIPAFYKYSVDGRLYGTYKLLGAKTGRYTSNSPNMLNTPSTKSIFSKPVKKCFIAPKGKIIGAADYNALEDRILANLSKDKNKCSIFTEKLDGHTVNALGYYPRRVTAVMPLTGDLVKDSINFYKLVQTGLVAACEIRQDGKAITFGLAYGAFPPKIAAMLKIPLYEAQELFNNYHNVLYPGITDYRENYVLKTATENGELHLGLGFTIATDDAGSDIRTLANGTCQFWSILTAISINKFHSCIDAAGYEDRVKVISTIYDSIYVEMDDDIDIIKWVNNTLIKIMLKDFMHDQVIPNTAELDIGYDWATMLTLDNNAGKKHIKTKRAELKTL